MYVDTQHLCYEQDVTQILKLVWNQFCFSYIRYHNNVKQLSLSNWRENSWIHTFPKSISLSSQLGL